MKADENMFCADPSNIKMFVLDEADEMLSRGFKDQIYDVFRFMPSEIQVVPAFFFEYVLFRLWVWFRMSKIASCLFFHGLFMKASSEEF